MQLQAPFRAVHLAIEDSIHNSQKKNRLPYIHTVLQRASHHFNLLEIDTRKLKKVIHTQLFPYQSLLSACNHSKCILGDLNACGIINSDSPLRRWEFLELGCPVLCENAYILSFMQNDCSLMC